MRSYRSRSLWGVCVGLLLASSMAFASPQVEQRQRAYEAAYMHVQVAEKAISAMVVKHDQKSDERPDVIIKSGVAVASPVAGDSAIDHRYHAVLAQIAPAFGPDALAIGSQEASFGPDLVLSSVAPGVGQRILVTADERMSAATQENMI